MKQKNSHFTQIPGKINDFLENCITMFLGHFWSFWPDGDFFPKNLATTIQHNYI